MEKEEPEKLGQTEAQQIKITKKKGYRSNSKADGVDQAKFGEFLSRSLIG